MQFVRYVPMLAARGARVILLVNEALCGLLAGVDGVAQCLPRSDGAPDADFHVPLSSLPLAFATRLDTIPVATAYLKASPERVAAWAERLGAPHRVRIGLVWSGNPNHLNDHNRSLPLTLLEPLLDLDATFVSLQKLVKSQDRALLAKAGVLDVAADLTDFAETAALISCLDLVITVDTSVAHLAGALGCATWILLPYSPDYRWLLDREDSPWYPTAKLFRQDETRDYARVIARVVGELGAKIAAWSPPARGSV
jgi:hypothetical protein